MISTASGPLWPAARPPARPPACSPARLLVRSSACSSTRLLVLLRAAACSTYLSARTPANPPAHPRPLALFRLSGCPPARPPGSPARPPGSPASLHDSVLVDVLLLRRACGRLALILPLVEQVSTADIRRDLRHTLVHCPTCSSTLLLTSSPLRMPARQRSRLPSLLLVSSSHSPVRLLV